MQVPPSDILKPFIRHYLFLDINETGTERCLRFFPDGSCSLVLTPGSGLYRPAAVVSNLPPAFLFGARTTYEEVLIKEAVKIIAVVFRPDGIYRLMGIPTLQLKDTLIPLDAVWRNTAARLYDRLQQADATAWPNILNHFLSARVPSAKNDGMVTAALYHIHKNTGIISSRELTSLLGYSERQVERKFLFETGITPSAYSGIVKVHTFLNYLYQYPGESLTRLAYNARYADQSHLIKAFRKVTGLTPTEYLNIRNKPARNFIGSLTGGGSV